MYIENKASGAILHILRWQSGEGSLALPVVPTPSYGGLAGCPGSGSSDVQIALNGAPQVTKSAPFYDYHRAALACAANLGILTTSTPSLYGPLPDIGANWPLPV